MPEEKEQTRLEKSTLPFGIKNLFESWISLKSELDPASWSSAFELQEPEQATFINLKGCNNYRVNLA